MRDWNIKYKRNQLCIVKPNGKQVTIEAVHGCKWGEVIYDVREVDTRIGYPASQDSLAPVRAKEVSRG